MELLVKYLLSNFFAEAGAMERAAPWVSAEAIVDIHQLLPQGKVDGL